MVQMTADVHQHCVPSGFVDRARAEGERFGFPVRDGEKGPVLELPNGVIQPVAGHGGRLSDQSVRLAELTEAGIDISMKSIFPRMMSYDAPEESAVWLAKSVNDALVEEMEADPDHVVAMGTVPLQFPKLAIEELERIATTHQVPCIQIMTHVGEENLDDPALYDFWAVAEQMGTLVFVHPSSPAAESRLPRYHLINLIGNPLEDSIAVASIIFGGVLDRYPGLKMCFAHAGGYAPWIRGRWRHGQSVRSESRERGAHRSVDDYFGMLYFDTIIHDEAAFRFLVDTVGTSRIVHGTDYPADMSDWHQVPRIRGLDWMSDGDKQDILGGTALNLIGRTS